MTVDGQSVSLTDMGEIIYTDTSSIPIANHKTEYTLPTALAAGKLKDVYIQGEDDDADDNRWVEIRNWRIEITATGTAEELILPYQYAADLDLMLVYIAPHPELTVYTSKLSETVPLNNIIYPSVLNCLRKKKAERPDDPRYNTEIVKYETKVASLQPLAVPRKKGRLLTLGAVGRLKSEPDKVYLW